ncbi:MAG: 3-dehydroquinate synthase, partial [Rhodospirillaceae bacterium]|nr:3-dehydroquinate synthase [Rhodospirillaceae bacterium]
LDPDNRRRLQSNGIVVYLRTTVKQQLERTRHTQQRPLLLDGDPAVILARLMQVRGPLYEALADISIDTGGQRVRTVVDQIKTRLAEHDYAPLKK